MNEKEKEILINYINKMKKQKTNFMSIFTSIQIIFHHLSREKNISMKQTIISYIQKYLNNKNISKDCMNFFLNEGKYLKMENLLHIFSYFEKLCFDNIEKKLKNEYKKEISEDIKKDILNFVNNSDNASFTKKDLSNALRRFISRYLVGSLDNSFIGKELYLYLGKEDLWDEKILKKGDLLEINLQKLYDFHLKNEQAYALYKLIEK